MITIPLRKSTGSMSQSPPISNPSWENKLFSALEGLRDTLHGALRTTLDVDLDIINDANNFYTAPVFIGSDKQEMNLLMRTESHRSMIYSTDAPFNTSGYCSTVPNRFSPISSTTYVSTSAPVYIDNGGGSFLDGDISEETISFDSSLTYKAESFKFLLGTNQYDFFDCDSGYLGLSRPSEGQDYPSLIL